MDPGLRGGPGAESNGGGRLRCGNGDKSTQWEETGEQSPRNTAHALEGGGVALSEGPCRRKANLSAPPQDRVHT